MQPKTKLGQVEAVNKSNGEITIDPSRCKGCGLCVLSCPKTSIELADEVDSRGIRVACRRKDQQCSGCGFCYIICPDTAITVYKISNR